MLLAIHPSHQLLRSAYRKKARRASATLTSATFARRFACRAKYLSTSFNEILRRLFRWLEYHFRNFAVFHTRP
jgi:hypothetical protein